MRYVAIPLLSGLLLAVSCTAPGAGAASTPAAAPAPTVPVESVPAPTPSNAALNTISINDINRLSLYWNPFWSHLDASVLPEELAQIDARYIEKHPYVAGETDCNELAIGVWNKLMESGIVSIIVAGNLDQDEYEFSQCNHAWLLVFYLPDGANKPASFALETTTGELYLDGDAANDARVNRYWSGYLYALPSHLRKDLGKPPLG